MAGARLSSRFNVPPTCASVFQRLSTEAMSGRLAPVPVRQHSAVRPRSMIETPVTSLCSPSRNLSLIFEGRFFRPFPLGIAACPRNRRSNCNSK
jgi:hypothetical protein